MVYIETSVTGDAERLKGKVLVRCEKAAIAEICATVHTLVNTLIENFEIPGDMKDLVGVYVGKALYAQYKEQATRWMGWEEL